MIYTVVEHPDGDFLERWFGDDDGLLYKPSGPTGALQYQGEDASAYRSLAPQRGDDDADHSAFVALAASISERPGAPPLEEVLDVDGALRYLASVVVLGALDSYIGPGHNYYLYEQGGRFTVIPWDFNGAFGIFNCNCDHDGVVRFRVDEPVCGAPEERPLAGLLLADDARRAAYHGYLEQLLDGPFAPPALQARIETVAAMIEPYVVDDERALYSPEEFRDNLENDHVEAGGRVLPGLLAFARERGESIRAQLAGQEPSTTDGEGNCPRRRPRP